MWLPKWNDNDPFKCIRNFLILRKYEYCPTSNNIKLYLKCHKKPQNSNNQKGFFFFDVNKKDLKVNLMDMVHVNLNK